MPSPVRQVVDLLGDADPDIRLRSVMRLGEARHEQAAAALVARFGVEREFAVRETLTWAALRMPKATLPLVRAALSSQRWLTRLQAVHTLSKVADPDDAERLIPPIGDPVDAVAARTYGAAAECGNDVVIPALVGELSRGSSEHRNSLSVAVSSFGAGAVPALIGALRSGHTAPVRSHAADILAYLGSPAADPAQRALATAVDDSHEEVRLAALNALGQLRLPTAWEVVAARTASAEPRLRVLAGRLMERRPGAQVLRAASKHDDRVGCTDDGDAITGPAGGGDVDTGPGGDGDVDTGPVHCWPEPDLDLVTCEGGAFVTELAPKLARQVEFCRPQYLARGDVPDEVLATVHADALRHALAGGRSEAMARRIAAGAVEQYLHEHVFMEQVSVADPGVLVKDLLFGKGVHVTHFVRLDPVGAA